ncbi:MAG: nuclear transport factor 2 family protein [Chthoniobacter sp.]|nr:nuclear transport factor 2 family protein [Chthoniobacter sp.]
MTNIEIVQELYRSSRSEDYDAFRAICTDDLEWVQMPGFPGGATWHGPQAVIEGVFQGNDGRWDAFGFDIAEYLDAGTHVVVVGIYRGTHRVSGRSFSASAVHIYDLRDGRVCRFRQFTDTKVICDALP